MSSETVKELADKLVQAETEQTNIRAGVEALTVRVDKQTSKQQKKL